MQPPRPILVLVVDDDKYSRVFVQRFVAAPARTAGAANGREALAAVIADPPDAIVMDFEMPVLFVTAQMTASDLENTDNQIGGRPAISKQAPPHELEKRIASLILA